MGRLKGKVKSVRSDRGSEFVDAQFKDLLQRRSIKQILSLPAKPWSNGGVERANGTLKRLIMKNMKMTGSNKWVKDLQTLVDNYNRAVNDVIKISPVEAERQYLDGEKQQVKGTRDAIEKRILRPSKRKEYDDSFCPSNEESDGS